MKPKIIIFVVVLALLAGLLWWSGSNKPGTDKANTPAAGMSGMMGQMTEIKGTTLPTVSKITITAQDTDGKEFPAVELGSGEVKPLSGTPYSVRFTEFYTHWVWDRKPVNMSFEEQNPAVKVEVLQDGKLQYSAWGFKNMPFFRMGHHAPSAGVETQKQLAFTLVNYEGLKLPAGAGGRG